MGKVKDEKEVVKGVGKVKGEWRWIGWRYERVRLGRG